MKLMDVVAIDSFTFINHHKAEHGATNLQRTCILSQRFCNKTAAQTNKLLYLLFTIFIGLLHMRGLLQ